MKKKLLLTMLCLGLAFHCQRKKTIKPNLSASQLLVSSDQDLLPITPLGENAPVYPAQTLSRSLSYRLSAAEGIPDVQGRSIARQNNGDFDIYIEGEKIQIALPSYLLMQDNLDLSLVAYKKAIHLKDEKSTNEPNALQIMATEKLSFVNMKTEPVSKHIKTRGKQTLSINPLDYIDIKNPDQDFIIQFALVENRGVNSNSYLAFPLVATVTKLADAASDYQVKFFDKNTWGEPLAKQIFFDTRDAVKSTLWMDETKINNPLMITFRAPKPVGLNSASDLDQQLCYGMNSPNPICYSIHLAMRRAIAENNYIRPSSCVNAQGNCGLDLQNESNYTNSTLDNKYIVISNRNSFLDIQLSGDDLLFSFPLSQTYVGDFNGKPILPSATQDELQDLNLNNMVPGQLAEQRSYAPYHRAYLYGAPNHPSIQKIGQLKDELVARKISNNSKVILIASIVGLITVGIVTGIVIATLPSKDKIPVCNKDEYLNSEYNLCYYDGYKADYGLSYGYKISTGKAGKQCADNEEWMGNLQKCEVKCPNGQNVAVDGTCKLCASDAQWNGKRCVSVTECTSGGNWNGQTCVTCGTNEIWNHVASKCVCNSASKPSPVTGKCMGPCPYGISADGSCIDDSAASRPSYYVDYNNYYLQVNLNTSTLNPLIPGYPIVANINHYSDISLTSQAIDAHFCQKGCYNSTILTIPLSPTYMNINGQLTPTTEAEVFSNSVILKKKKVAIPARGFIFMSNWGK
jgi:hypothetical protein